MSSRCCRHGGRGYNAEALDHIYVDEVSGVFSCSADYQLTIMQQKFAADSIRGRGG